MSYASRVRKATSRCASFALSLLVLGACGGAPPRTRAPVAAKKPAPDVKKPATPRDRLLAVLHTVKPAGPVLGALDQRARADLDALVKQITPAQRSQIAHSESPFAAQRPLLYLALDGDSPDAYLALATQGRGADELAGMRRRNGGTDVSDLVQVAAELSRRAAAQWLRDRTVDVGSDKALTPELCDQIDAVATTLHRLDIRRRARETAEKLDPSAARALQVARAAAWQLDVPAARAALDRARSRGADGEALRPVRHLVDEAVLVHKAKEAKLGLDETVKAARALLDLGHPERVDALVGAHRAQAGSHLALASVLALATVGSGMCQGVPEGAGNALICATAWHDSKSIAKAVGLLDSAWKSGKGRDDASIETWLGMEYVLPWVYQTVRDSASSAADAKQRFKSRLAATQRAVREASAASHTFDGLVLFIDASAAGLAASERKKEGHRVHLEPAVQKGLEKRALDLGKQSPTERFTQAAVLAVAGMLSQEQDIGPLLDLLPDPVAPQYRHVRAVLEAWNALAHGGGSKGRTLLARQIPETEPHSLARAKTVLLMAELDAALTRTPHAYNVLSQIAGQLTRAQTPLALRLQAGVDRAGALARVGRTADAEKLLSKLVAAGIPKGSGDKHSLALLAKAYQLVLRARAAKGDTRQKYVEQLSHVVTGKDASSGVGLWCDLWQRELAYQTKKEQCGGLKVCLARAAKQRAVPRAEIESRLGPVTSRILRAGTLTMGTLDVQFNFGHDAGLQPKVHLKPRLLAVELPPKL